MAVALAGAALALGVGAAGAAGAFGQPGVQNPWGTNADMVNAQVATAPALVRANSELDPIINANQQLLAYQNLFGAPAVAPVGTKGAASLGSPAVAGLIPTLQKGLPMLQTLQNNLGDSSIAGLVSRLSTYGAPGLAAIRAANPEGSDLMSTLANQAQQQLNTNGGLTPVQLRLLQQNIRGAQTARGVGTGVGDAAQEAYYVANNQNALRQQNQTLASGVLGQEGQLYTDPFLSLLGMSTGLNVGTPSVNNTGPTALSLGLDQSSTAGLYGADYNATNQSNVAGWNAQMAGWGAIGGAGSGLGSGLSNLFPSAGGAAGAGSYGAAAGASMSPQQLYDMQAALGSY